MKNFYKLNFGSNFLKEGLNLESFEGDNLWHTFSLDPKLYINTQVHKKLLSLGIYPDRLLLFRGTPGESTQIHTDSDNTISRTWAINLSWGVTESYMSWYKIKNYSNNISFTTVGSPFVIFDKADVEEIERTEDIRTPTLVRIDVPHKVENKDKLNFRYCFSLRGVSKYKSWESIVDAFSDIIEN